MTAIPVNEPKGFFFEYLLEFLNEPRRMLAAWGVTPETPAPFQLVWHHEAPAPGDYSRCPAILLHAEGPEPERHAELHPALRRLGAALQKAGVAQAQVL